MAGQQRLARLTGKSISSVKSRDSLEVYAHRPLDDAGGHAATADGIYYASQLTERGAQQTSISSISSRGSLEAGVVERVEGLQTNLEIEFLAKPRDISPFNYA